MTGARAPGAAEDGGQAADGRVDAVLAAMTVEEKAGQVNQRLHGWRAVERDRRGAFRLTGYAREEIDRWGGLGALYGLFRADAWSGRSWANGIRPEERAEAAAAVQEAVAAADRHGVGTLLVEEAPHGHQALGGTLLPVNLAVAAAWRPESLADAARGVGAELAASGVHVALVSALDILRDPRWGRGEECYGEDPLLAAELTRAVVEGMQGEARSRVGDGGVAVVLKHLAAQGEAVGGRNGQSAHLGPHDLAEIHLPPVEAGLRAGALGFMAAYNDIDGVPCCANHDLLTAYLRGRHGFDGIVMADGLAVDRLAGTTGDLPGAARAALLAGVDLSLWDESFAGLAALAAADAQVAAALDVACRRVLTLKDRLGLLGDPGRPVRPDAARSLARLTAARRSTGAASRRLAAESLVLLRNARREDGGATLPFDAARLRSVTVVGPHADDVPALLGDYVPPLPAGAGRGVAEALRAALPGAETTAGEAFDDVGAAAFAGADAVVVVIGGTSHRSYDAAFADNGAVAARAGEATGGEGVDLADVSLPAGQDDLMRAVRAATDAPVAAVVVSGRPHVLTGALEHCDAVLWAGYPGPYGGEAVADALLGEAEPTGRLPMTLPRHPAAVPVRYNDRQSAADVYRDAPEPVLLPFGFGLGYRDVAVTGLDVTVRPDSPAEVVVTVTAANRSGRPSDPVIPVFAHRTGGTRTPRIRELLAFGRVTVGPGATAAITFTLPAERVFADLADPGAPTAVTELYVEGLTRTIRPARG
ncbi:glycoside hydrolase family 3 N-terminal domain-containing protein [Streptomyces synnematoformans]|uniref:Glycoside hydrolase family 3 N-terminal domain-containing protein n=1 Tax=Streptomyces synnematoformans TaxID=415721 RepID=A0ABP5JUU9_9ACTN